MAFESQLAAQREQSKQRVIIKQSVFMLRVFERQRGNKKELVLDVRVPLEVLKKAKFADSAVDIFFDHETHKCMIAPSLAGLKLTVKPDAYATQQFLFTKGFTPDFGNGGVIVNNYELVPHGDGHGVVFDYPPLTMVTGRNKLDKDETPTRAQTFALALLAKERERVDSALREVAERRADDEQARESALPQTAIKFKPREKQAGERLPRRSFTDAEKKEGVRAHIRWMNAGKSYNAACDEVGVAVSVMHKWRELFLKDVEREERRLGQANHGHKATHKAKLNGSGAHAQH